MSACCYILYSSELDRYYIGASRSTVTMRIEKHKSRYYGTKSYTAQTDDWELFLLLPADDYSHAIRLERHIKSMKSRRYIASLKKNPDLVNRLLDRTRQRFTDRL